MNHQNPDGSTLDRGDPRLELSLERTEYALERTYLAWMRTIITLILSGFALDKLVEVFHQSRLISGQALIKPAHITAIIFSLTGILLLCVKTFFYIKRTGELARRRGAKITGTISGIILSLVIFLVGIRLANLTIISGP